MTNAVIQAQQLAKVFNPASEEQVVALQDITLEVQPEEFISLIGPSGCGKSTLLRLIAGLVAPSEGELLVNNKSPQQARIDRDYGMVFQAATLLEWRSVRKNIELPLEIQGVPAQERRQKAQAALELVELDGFGDHWPWQLSGGMQQRVAIARALVFQPSLLLMDEPFGALDEFTRERMNMELLHIWRETETTVLFVTHSIPEAIFLSNRVVVMSPRPGRITAIVEVELPRPRNFETRALPLFHEQVAQVRELMRDAHGG